MQRDKLLKQNVILKLREQDTVISGTVIDANDDGFWLTLKAAIALHFAWY